MNHIPPSFAEVSSPDHDHGLDQFNILVDHGLSSYVKIFILHGSGGSKPLDR